MGKHEVYNFLKEEKKWASLNDLCFELGVSYRSVSRCVNCLYGEGVLEKKVKQRLVYVKVKKN